MNFPSTSPTGKDESIHNIQFHQRINISMLGLLERPLLQWLAARMPARVLPDHLTALGLIGSLIICAGYVLSNLAPGFLWLASFGYVINWLGDSLDGTLARFRAIEKPAYGFFIDHAVDALNATFAFLGMGLSPYVRFDVGCLVLITYLLIAFLITLQTNVNGIFKLSYGLVGPTETRVIAVLANTLAYFLGIHNFHLFGITLTIFDLLCIMLTGIGYAFFIVMLFTQARELKRREKI